MTEKTSNSHLPHLRKRGRHLLVHYGLRGWQPHFLVSAKLWGLVLAGLFMCASLQAQRINYKSQSLLIYKFSLYVSWPEDAIGDTLYIGVYGNSPILSELKLMSSIKKAGGGRPISVIPINSAADMRKVHILYLASSRSRELRSLVQQMKDQSVLIVAERGGLARKGACINFILMEDDTLRYEYNIQELENRRLEMSEEFTRFGFKVN
ncbi:MAG: YfiR family protein [Bacteroidota bacterium]